VGSKRQRQRRESPSPGVAKQVPGKAPSRRIVDFLEQRSRILAIAAVLLATVRIAATYHVFDHTSDEPAHVACGMEFLDKGTYTWEPQHPPLARVAVALGPYLIGDRPAGTPHDASGFPLFREGAKILYEGNHYELALSLARAGVLPFFWIACGVVYLWGSRYFSRSVAALAVIFFSSLPPVLAHSSLATTDIALTAFFAATFLAGRIWIGNPTPRNAAWLGIAAGLMVLSKFSCLVFFPASVLLALVWYWRRMRLSIGVVGKAAGERAPTLAMALGIGLAVVWAGYRFSFGHTPVLSFAVPFPELFSGIKQVADHNARGHLDYLLGTVGAYGFWDFFLVAIGVKTPLGFLALLAVGVVLAFRKNPPFQELWLPLAFSFGILAVAIFSRINIGIRHVLPVYAGFSLVAAVAALHLLQAPRSRLAAGAAAVFCAWFGISSLISHPDYLAYFNELGGSHPENILVDSDLDWGQDQKRLAHRLKELGVTEVYFSPYIIADLYREGFPRTFFINRTVPSPGWNAVSVTEWKELRQTIWPDRIPPLERVGKSMLLWYFDPRSGLPPPIRKEVHDWDLENFGRGQPVQ